MSLTTVSIIALVLPSGCSGNQKVTFCHHPLGNPENPQTLTVSTKALSGIANEKLDYQDECFDEDTGGSAPVISANECEEGGPC